MSTYHLGHLDILLPVPHHLEPTLHPSSLACRFQIWFLCDIMAHYQLLSRVKLSGQAGLTWESQPQTLPAVYSLPRSTFCILAMPRLWLPLHVYQATVTTVHATDTKM